MFVPHFVAGASSVFLCRFDYGPKANVIVTFVIECVLYSLWKFRNRATFDNYVGHSEDIVRFCKSDIRDRIAVERYRLQDDMFREIWIVGEISGKSGPD